MEKNRTLELAKIYKNALNEMKLEKWRDDIERETK